MEIPPEEERFALATTQLANAVYESVLHLNKLGYPTADPMLVQIVSCTIAIFDKHYLISGFIENSHHKCWDGIKRKDEQYFADNAGDIFKYLPSDKVNLFKDLFTTKDNNGKSVICQQTKDDVWELFTKMVKISIKYIHKYRSPVAISNNNGIITNKYEKSFHDEVNLAYHAKIWGVTLEFNLQY